MTLKPPKKPWGEREHLFTAKNILTLEQIEATNQARSIYHAWDRRSRRKTTARHPRNSKVKTLVQNGVCLDEGFLEAFEKMKGGK